MDREKSGFVKVEDLMAQVSLEQMAAYYGIDLPEMRRSGNEVRMRCFLACGRHGETGERVLAIQTEHRAKIWRCFEGGCGKGGNLVSLCDFLKPGENGGGKPRGERFKGILKDLQAMAVGRPATEGVEEDGGQGAAEVVGPGERSEGQKKALPYRNVPLATSPKERAKALVHLDEKFVVDPAAMSPKAASYFRQRPFLTPEMCRQWRIGYLPRDTGGDHAGGTMRGKIVYPLLSEEGDVLTWFGRDPEYEGKFHEWVVGGKQGREPEKYHFVKGFERGWELFGQHRLREEGVAEKIRENGLIVVPGPNDVMALDALGAPAVGVCSTSITRAQAEKVALLVREAGHGVAVVMLDCTEAGELAARRMVVELAEFCPVRLAWSEAMHAAAFRGREVESLKLEEWERIRGLLIEKE